MASNDYFGGYYASNHQQSQPQQQYSRYETLPAANNVQPTRHYQGAVPAVTTQSIDYMSHPSYSEREMYNGQGDGSWGQNNYGGSRESTRGAAEVLSNMSNHSYAPNSVGIPNAPRHPTSSQAHQSHQNDATRSSHPHLSYGQATQPRLGVNAHRTQTPTSRGLPSPQYLTPTTQTFMNQQRPASPAQLQYHQVAAHSTHPDRSSNTPSSMPYTESSNRQHPGVASHAIPIPSQQVPESVVHTDPTHGVTNQYNQVHTTVDPTAVYDPWPEMERKREAARAKQAAEDAARAEEQRKAEEEKRKIEEKVAEEQMLQGSREAQQKQRNTVSQPAVVESVEPPQVSDDGESNALEAEIRAMMARMREFNSKDPSLLARIWEEERKVKTPKSPTAQSKPSQPAAPKPADPSQRPPVPQATHQMKSSVPKSALTSKKQAAAAAKSTAPTPQPAVSQLQAKPAGNTIWPQDKKGQLASAAATFLNSRNPNMPVTSQHILEMLDSNPPYIQLCEQLEAMGLKLDRGALARDLLIAVPDVNSASRAQTQAQTKKAVQAQALAQRQPATGLSYVNGSAQKVPPPAIMRNDINKPPTPTTASIKSPSAAPTPYAVRSPYSSFPPSGSVSEAAVPVAQMVPIKPELKPPANKEEAARKRTFNDLIDLTQDPDQEDENLPPPKKLQANSPLETVANESAGMGNNFPMTVTALPRPNPIASAPQPRPVEDIVFKNIVQPIDKKYAMRRNTYNIKTIARDVLLACGRHPDQRPLNQHLEILKQNLPSVDVISDLSTLKWDVIDPGQPPRGYFRSSGISEVGDADDEDDSEDDVERPLVHTARQDVGVGEDSQGRFRVPMSTNPFKKKGRPPRASFPLDLSPQAKRTPDAPASAPRPSAAGVGYAAFKGATNADGTPAKRRGRPVGWRKAIHGSAAAQARTAENGLTSSSTPQGHNTLQNDKPGGKNKSPIVIASRSPSVTANARQRNSKPQLPAFKCQWHNCRAELHNLDTLRKHLVKIHNKQSLRGTYECLWGDCGQVSTRVDQATGIRIEQNIPFSFVTASEWTAHLESAHLTPLSWTLGDGPASGLSDTYDSASEAYMSDAHGRRVTPRITVSPSRFQGQNTSQATSSSAPRGRGRPTKSHERAARAAQQTMVNQKKRVGGPGMDRGGASLVNDKRRRGFLDNDETEEFIDAED